MGMRSCHILSRCGNGQETAKSYFRGAGEIVGGDPKPAKAMRSHRVRLLSGRVQQSIRGPEVAGGGVSTSGRSTSWSARQRPPAALVGRFR
jgi:hypothetical protein